MALNISDVRLDGGTQPRAGIDQAVVREYAEDEEAGAEFPPVQVVYDGKEYWLWDGFHRLEARKARRQRTVPAIVRQGTRRDAVLLSVGANATHGFRRTNEDKRRAVMALLHDEEWRQWSDREIARRCAGSNQFVSNVRAELSVNDGQIETRRVVRNGTEYTMTPPQRSAAPAVASQAAKYMTTAELVTALREWSQAFEDQIVALDGLRTDWMNGQGSYMDDWENSAPAPWRMEDAKTAVYAILQQMQRDESIANLRARKAEADAEWERQQAEYRARSESGPSQVAQATDDSVKTVDWRRTRGTITEDGRILVQMSDGTKTPPWLELDDAGQHWMLAMIAQAQEAR
jgi:hypothetical protein